MKTTNFNALLKSINKARAIKAGQRKSSQTREKYTALMETLEIMTDEHLMADLRRSIREAKAGKLIPWERAKRKLRSSLV